MVTSIILQNCSLEDIKKLFEELQQLLLEINSKLSTDYKVEYLTRAETARLLKCDLSTVHNWTKKGKLNAYYKGNRVYYKLCEIDSGMIPIDHKRRG